VLFNKGPKRGRLLRKKIKVQIVFITLVLIFTSGCTNSTNPADIEPTSCGDLNKGKADAAPGQGEIENIGQDSQGSEAGKTDLDAGSLFSLSDFKQDSAFSEKELEGLVVVFENRGSIYFVEGNRSPEILVEGTVNETENYFPLLSTDGKKVTFHHREYEDDYLIKTYELKIINTDGSEEKVLISQSEMARLADAEETLNGDKEVYLAIRNLAWLPQSGKLAFQTYYVYAGFWQFQNDLWLVDPESGEITRILENETCGKYAFSPDEMSLIISDDNSLTLMNSDGTNRQRLFTYPVVRTDYEYNFYPQPRWAPDGSYALIAVPGPDPFLYERGEPEETAIWRILPSGELEKLYSINWPGLTGQMNGDIFSPDSQKVLSAEFEGGLPLKSQVMHLDGQVLASFSPSTEVCGWSTDSTKLILKNGQDLLVGVDGSIFSLNIDGEPVIWNVRWVSPSIFVSSGYPGSAANKMLWTGSTDGKLKVISDSFDGYEFDAIMIR
jgi:WD40 repeat protein